MKPHHRRFSPAMLAAVIVGMVLSFAGSGCAPGRRTPGNPVGAATATAPEAWILAARHPFPFDAGHPVIPAGLVDACRGARLVGLGEFSHGTHEDALFKSALALALIDAGEVETLYIEANRTGGEQLDAFIRSGGGDARDAVARAGIFRVLKSEGFAHLIAGMQRRVAAGKRLRIVGIDCQDSRRDAGVALDRLAARNAAEAGRLRAKLAPIVGAEAGRLRHPQLMQALDARRIHACIDALGELEGALSADPFGASLAQRARQGLLSYEHETSDGDYQRADAGYFSRRDRFMAENILADGAGKGAFWGHNIHVMGGPRASIPDYVPSGTVLREALGKGYRVMVCDYRRARISLVVSDLATGIPDALSPQQTVGRDLVRGGLAEAIAGPGGASFWIDLSRMPSSPAFEAWRATPRASDWPGYTAPRERRNEDLFRVPIGRLVDVVVVFEDVGPARWIPAQGGAVP